MPALLPLLLPLAVVAVPLLDLLLAVVRRTRAGRSPVRPGQAAPAPPPARAGPLAAPGRAAHVRVAALLAFSAVGLAFVPVGVAAVWFVCGVAVLVVAVRWPGCDRAASAGACTRRAAAAPDRAPPPRDQSRRCRRVTPAGTCPPSPADRRRSGRCPRPRRPRRPAGAPSWCTSAVGVVAPSSAAVVGRRPAALGAALGAAHRAGVLRRRAVVVVGSCATVAEIALTGGAGRVPRSDPRAVRAHRAAAGRDLARPEVFALDDRGLHRASGWRCGLALQRIKALVVEPVRPSTRRPRHRVDVRAPSRSRDPGQATAIAGPATVAATPGWYRRSRRRRPRPAGRAAATAACRRCGVGHRQPPDRRHPVYGGIGWLLANGWDTELYFVAGGVLIGGRPGRCSCCSVRLEPSRPEPETQRQDRRDRSSHGGSRPMAA